MPIMVKFVRLIDYGCLCGVYSCCNALCTFFTIFKPWHRRLTEKGLFLLEQLFAILIIAPRLASGIATDTNFVLTWCISLMTSEILNDDEFGLYGSSLYNSSYVDTVSQNYG